MCAKPTRAHTNDTRIHSEHRSLNLKFIKTNPLTPLSLPSHQTGTFTVESLVNRLESQSLNLGQNGLNPQGAISFSAAPNAWDSNSASFVIPWPTVTTHNVNEPCTIEVYSMCRGDWFFGF